MKYILSVYVDVPQIIPILLQCTRIHLSLIAYPGILIFYNQGTEFRKRPK